MLSLFFKLVPYLVLLYAGIFSILEVLFPSLRDPDFNHWEVDDGTASSVTILGWKKILTPPRVIAQGFMSNRMACTIALIFGVLFISIAVFGVRHVSGYPAFVPDLFDRL